MAKNKGVGPLGIYKKHQVGFNLLGGCGDFYCAGLNLAMRRFASALARPETLCLSFGTYKRSGHAPWAKVPVPNILSRSRENSLISGTYFPNTFFTKSGDSLTLACIY